MMTNVQIDLPGGSYSGPVTMNSSSHFYMVRAQRSDIPLYSDEFDRAGVYLLLIGKNGIYVGQSALDTVKRRIFNTHTGTIDASWHTVVGFMCNKKLSANELLFLENGMCEYIRGQYECLTTTPSAANCNAKYRREHYGLGSGQIQMCNNYLADMEHFLSLLPGTAFAGLPIPTEIQCPLTDNKSCAAQPNTITVDDHTDEQPVDDEEQLREAEKTADEQAANDQDSSEGQDAESGESVLFHHRNKPRDSEGTARILIHCGHTGRRKTVLLAGTRVSNVIAEGYNRIAEQRQALEAQGKLIDRILQEDISFDSQSAAAQFLDGNSMSGNTAWLTVEGDVPLKEML